MAINELIARGGTPIQFESPMNQLAKMMQMQQMQQGIDKGQMEQDQYRQATERKNNLLKLMGGLGAGATDEQRSAALKGGGYFDEADKLDTGALKRREITSKASAEDIATAQKKIDIAGQAFNHVRQNPTLENAHAVIDYLGANGVYSPEMVAQYKAQVSANPAEIGRLADVAFRGALAAKDQLSKNTSENLGGNMAYNSTDPLTGKVTQTGSAPITESANNAANNARTAAEGAANRGVTLRGQNMTDSRARDTIQNGKIPPGYRMKPDGTMEAIPGGPADLKQGAEGVKRVNDAKDVLSLLDDVDALLPKATGGWVGTGADSVMGAFGSSTAGAEATDKLKVLQGALVSKMPKMSGPQSDKDVLLYREMAGQVGDSTLPVARRQAAAAEVRRLNEKYAGMQDGESKQKPTAKPAGTSATPLANSKGWKLHMDAKGNKAYVGPNNEVEEVR